MKSRTPNSAMLGILTAGVVNYFGVAACEASDRSRPSIDSGQPRDLINQPICWPPEQSEESRHCDFAQKI